MLGLTRKRKYDPVPTKYSANRALIGLYIQTVQLHSTTLTLILDTLKLKNARIALTSFIISKTLERKAFHARN